MSPMPLRTRMAALALALPLAGCAARMETAATERAAHDFHCPAKAVTLEEVAYGEYRAAGCGQEASYQVVGECYFEWTVCHAQPLAKRGEKSPARP